MEYVTLGKSDLKVSRLAFGCLALGGYGVGKVDFDEIELAMNDAVEKGVNFFDVADVYGFGQAEQLLGAWTKGKRSELIISTKFGVRKSSDGNIFYDNSADWMDTALNSSLDRLKTDYIDLYFMHHHDGKTHLYDIFERLERKCESGQIRFYGVSNLGFSTVEKYLGDFPGLVAQQNEYSLVNRKNEKDSLKFEEDGVGLTAFGCLGQGILSGKYGREASFGANDVRSNPKYVNFHGDKFEKNLSLLDEVNKLAQSSNLLTSQVAIRWVLDRFKGSVALLGVKSPTQLSQLVDSFAYSFSDDEVKFLEKVSSIYQ